WMRIRYVKEEQRRRLARVPDDEFGQSLTAINSYLWLIVHKPPEDPAALLARTAEARRVVADTLTAMRELSHLLRPPVLDDFGLVPSLDEHLKAFTKRHRIPANLPTARPPERLSPDVETAPYRIPPEALTTAV